MKLSEEKFLALKEALGVEWAERIRALVEQTDDPLASKELGGLRTGYKGDPHTVYVGLKHGAEQHKAVAKSPLAMDVEESCDAIMLSRAKASPGLGAIEPGKFYTTDELAVLLHVHRKSLARWCAEGRLHASKALDKRGWRISGKAVLDVLTR
jgi:hypothetical protein